MTRVVHLAMGGSIYGCGFGSGATSTAGGTEYAWFVWNCPSDVCNSSSNSTTSSSSEFDWTWTLTDYDQNNLTAGIIINSQNFPQLNNNNDYNVLNVTIINNSNSPQPIGLYFYYANKAQSCVSCANQPYTNLANGDQFIATFWVTPCDDLASGGFVCCLNNVANQQCSPC